MKLIVGLGNPGSDYENTRHNIGFMVLNSLLQQENWKAKFDSLYVKIDDVIYLKPQKYMNNSGFAVKKVVDFYKIKPENILVIQDDLDLPFNTFKLKKNSSSGGHNGIKSIIELLNTNVFCRLKIGIAHNKNIDTKDYVLGKFSKEDMGILSDTYIKVSNIVQDFINNDINTLKQIYSNKNN